MSRLPAGAVPLPQPTLAERHENNELMRVVRAYTYPVTFDARTIQIGTAVLLRDGDRLFAFTAAHNIADDTAIHLRLSPGTERTQFRILDTHVHPRYDARATTSRHDLAILELENVPTVPAGDVGQLYTGEFQRAVEGEPVPTGGVAFVWVVGFPTELVRLNNGTVSVCQTAFCTQILDAEPDEVSLYYPTTAYQMPHDGTICEVGELASTPHGYSGGGVWGVRVPDEGMFHPHRHVRLVGLQTYWSGERSRMIRCVPARVMLDVLRAFRPDL